MACLASWFPNIPVGLFGIVLAVLGALVSIIEFKGKKRFWWASAFILFGVLETTAIIRADRIHDAEVKAQHDEIEGIKKELSDARLENAANTGWLRAKLEDALQKGPP